jgi:succinyl-CoA synthetase beta subunit
MIVESIDFTRELYFAILLDRAFNGPVMVVSPKGGMDIEAVAEETPDEIYKVCTTPRSLSAALLAHSDPSSGISRFQSISTKALNKISSSTWPRS